MATIAFQFNPEKFTQVAAYITSRCRSGMTRKKLFKLLYFADREHLFRFGRPILKDFYINMDQGPVPSQAYDLVKGNAKKCTKEALDNFAKHIKVDGMRIGLRSPAGTDLLSKSDTSVLDEILRLYGHRSADYLGALSHRHKAWLESERNRRIDYSLFFEDPDTDSMRELVESNQPIRNLSKNVRISPQPRTS